MPKITIYHVATDNDCGTQSSIHLTEREADDAILEAVSKSRQDFEEWCAEEGHNSDDPNSINAFWNAHKDHLDTYTKDATEITVFPDLDRYDAALNELEIPPNGDDYNAIFELLQGRSYVAPTTAGR